MFRWPRPETTPEHFIKLKVSKSGMLDMTDWASMVRDAREFGVPLCAPARLWFGCIEHLLTPEKFVNLSDLFVAKGLADNDLDQGFAAQLAKVVGERIELVYYQSMQMCGCTWPVRAESGIDGEDWSLRAVDRLCQHHVAACMCVRPWGSGPSAWQSTSTQPTRSS